MDSVCGRVSPAGFEKKHATAAHSLLIGSGRGVIEITHRCRLHFKEWLTTSESFQLSCVCVYAPTHVSRRVNKCVCMHPPTHPPVCVCVISQTKTFYFSDCTHLV